MAMELTEKERMHLLHALECIKNSGDNAYDRMTAKLEKKLEQERERMLSGGKVSRGTRCLGAYKGVDCKGAYPAGYLKFLKGMGWWGEKRIHLCSGAVKDDGSFKVDIRPEMKPDLIADARNTGLPAESYDCVLIDPPYSAELAKTLYGTEAHYSRVDDFIKEGVRLAKPNGLIISLSYNIPKLQKECDLIAVWGIYEVPSVSSMRCMVVFRKKGKILTEG